MSTYTPDANDFLFAGGSRSFKFESVGDGIVGTISAAEVRQQTDPEGNPKSWPDGNPVMQLVVTIQTDLRESDDDDGTRRLYAKGGNYEGDGTSMLVAIREAVKKSGAQRLEVGGRLTVKHTGLGKKTSAAYSAPKLYRAKYEAPAAQAISIDDI